MGLIELSISVVSHRQIDLVQHLLFDINKYCNGHSFELIITVNEEEILPFEVDKFPFPIKIIMNPKPIGFAANHNQAFAQAVGRFFCVMNPDIRLFDDPFPTLIDVFQSSSMGVVAPLVISERGDIEDSARFFPSPFKIICKFLGGCKGGDYSLGNELIFPDWVGGMFMLFPRQIFASLNGFNQKFFLYYEDVDLCARLRLKGYEVVFCPKVKVMHDARRTSHKNIKYLKWHLISMIRFFFSAAYFQICCLKIFRASLK